MRLTLLSRTYCHLCHEMEQQVRARLPQGWGLEVVDIDQHPQLESQYDEQVPVLLAGEQELFHHFFDPAQWQAFLGRRGIG
ncbi:MAG: glutaredoxin family protein [Burkholderiaceae bacterium]|nr:MAG: glutaredoxin family protein [Burkholderiaceae bacterium]